MERSKRERADTMGLTSYLEVPELRAKYRKIKKYFSLRESAYDITSACQLRCDGCYYFEGEKYQVQDVRDPGAWRELLRKESNRGINFVNLAGAEPALAPKTLKACYEAIPSGCIFTNGLRPIPLEIRYRIHISVWGDETGDPVYRRYASGRKGPFCLPKQLENYRDDERAIFVYTFNGENVDQVDNVVQMVADSGRQLTFNVFSAPVDSRSVLKVRTRFELIRHKMHELIDRFPENVVYSKYNAKVHTAESSLREQFGCPYPRADGGRGFGMGNTFRHYTADLQANHDSCCVPDTDCAECRHYASGSAIVTSALDKHVGSEACFRGWLDYADTYLAVWVLGYQKGPNLYGGLSIC